MILAQRGGYIHNPSKQETRKIAREQGGGFEVDMYVPVNTNPGFIRQAANP